MAVCCGVLAVRVHGGVCPRRPGSFSDRHSRLSLNGSRSRSALWGPLCLTPHPQVSPVLPSSSLVRPQYNWAPSVCGRVPVTERTPATDRREGSGCPRAPQGPPRRRCPLGFGRCPKALPPHQPPADSDGPPRRPSFPTLSPGPGCSATLGQGGLFPSSSLPGSGSCSVDRRCLSGVSSFLSFVCCPDPAQPRVGQQRITQSARVLPPGKLDREGGGRQDAAVRPQPLQRERDAWGSGGWPGRRGDGVAKREPPTSPWTHTTPVHRPVRL